MNNEFIFILVAGVNDIVEDAIGSNRPVDFVSVA